MVLKGSYTSDFTLAKKEKIIGEMSETMQYMDVSKNGVYSANEYFDAEHDGKQKDVWFNNRRRIDDQKPKSLLIQLARMTCTKLGHQAKQNKIGTKTWVRCLYKLASPWRLSAGLEGALR